MCVRMQRKSWGSTLDLWDLPPIPGSPCQNEIMLEDPQLAFAAAAVAWLWVGGIPPTPDVMILQLEREKLSLFLCSPPPPTADWLGMQAVMDGVESSVWEWGNR